MREPMIRPTIVLATIIYCIILLPAILLAPFSVFLFDDGSADTLTFIFATVWFIFPGTLLISILGAWLTHVRLKNKIAGYFLLAPIAHALLIVFFGILQFAR